MDNLNLDSDEAVIYRTQKLIISGVGHEAVLTGKRLILIDSETGNIRREILYTDIELAASGTNALREPVITLTVRSADGDTRETDLIFIHRAGGLDVQDRDKCIAALRDQKVPVRAGPYRTAPLPMGRKDTGEALAPLEGEAKGRPAVPEMTVFGMAGASRQTLPEESSDRMPVIMIAAALLVLGVLAAGIFLTGPGTGTGTGIRDLTQGTATATAEVTLPEEPSLMTTPLPAPTATTVPAWVLLPGEIPPNGIWVRVTYPGNFTGSLRAQGWNYDVNSSGTYLYQLPVHDTLIEGSIEKMDGSAHTMDVEIYNGGVLVSKMTTAKPFGMVELHVDVGAAVISRSEVTAVPIVVAATPTPDSSLVLKAVPSTGVWVRVAYLGNYTGQIAANGLVRDVNSSGDQFYQFPISSGIIDGSIEKGDGSVRNLIIEVYKDGILLDQASTSAPLGTVEIHTRV
jgi:hypothetical protein